MIVLRKSFSDISNDQEKLYVNQNLELGSVEWDLVEIEILKEDIGKK